MKILYVITRAERGGGQVHVADLLRGFSQRHTVTLAIGELGYLTEEATRLGIAVQVIPGLRQRIAPFHDILAGIALYRLIRRLCPDVIHLHTSKAGFIGRLVGPLVRVPVIYTAHTWSFTEGTVPWRRRIFIVIERLCARFCAKIITVSAANKSLAIQVGVGRPDQLETIRNGIPDVIARSSPGADGPLRVVMTARFAHQKDQATLVRAVAPMAMDFQVLFAGSGPTMDSVRELAEHLGASHKFVFLGDCDGIEKILADAHIFVLSTLWEGLPLSIIEAMRAGLPVIGSNVGGIPELIEDGRSGFLVSPSDEEEMRSKLDLLLRDAELRANLGKASRAAYETYFRIDEMLQKTEAMYVEVSKTALPRTAIAERYL